MLKTTTTYAISRDDKSVAKLTLQLQFILGHTLNGNIEDKRFHSVMNINKKLIDGKIRNVVGEYPFFVVMDQSYYTCRYVCM